MANYTAHFLADSEIYASEPIMGIISGTVMKGGSPVSRRLLLYKQNSGSSILQTFSDIADGSFSFSIPFSGFQDTFTVVSKGEPSLEENDYIFTKIRAIFE